MVFGVGQLREGAVLVLEVDLHLKESGGVGLEGAEVDLYIEERGGVELDEEVSVLISDVCGGL
jgi:hypothetical protein